MRHHLVIGVTILLVLFGLGLWTTRYLDQSVGQAQQELRSAFYLAAEGELELAHEHTEKAEKGWEKTARLAACFSRHQELDPVDELFSELNAWYQVKNPQEYALVCRRLTIRLSTLAKGEKPYLYNLF